MRISRCGLPPIHNKGLAFRNGGGAMIEAFLLEIIYLLLFALVVETIIVFALIITILYFLYIKKLSKSLIIFQTYI